MKIFVRVLFALALAFSAGTALAESPKLAEGGFHGASGHVTTGHVVIRNTEAGPVVELAPDFNFDGAPDARVGFGKSGTFDPNSDLGALESNHGKQTYAVPANIDPSQYDEVYIWCRKFSVPLGVAKLQ